MRIIQAASAWQAREFGSPTVRVYVLDTGVDYTRIDLRAHVDHERSISLTGNSAGELDSAVAQGVAPYMDFHSHGTAVASMIVSNGIDLAGITTKTKIVAVKVQDRGRMGQFDTFLKGIYYAANNGADVIHLSLAVGFPRKSAGVPDPRIARFDSATTYAHERGAVIVAAGGNASQNLDDTTAWRTCNAAHVICVSATTARDEPAFNTAFGIKTVTVAGPGGDAATPVLVNCSSYSLVRTGNPAPCGAADAPRFETTGTTFGAAATSGLAALIISKIGKGQPNRVRQLIIDSADDLGDRGPDAYFGHGRINVASALRLMAAPAPPALSAR